MCIINNEGNIKNMTLDYYKVQLKKTAEQLSEFKKGILAVDESTKTIGKRLSDINLETRKRIDKHIVVGYSPHQT